MKYYHEIPIKMVMQCRAKQTRSNTGAIAASQPVHTGAREARVHIWATMEVVVK